MTKKTRSFGRKRWFFTIWDKTSEELVDILKRLECEKVIAAHDLAPTTHKPHHHVAIICTSLVKLEQWQKLLGLPNHYEPMKGSWNQAERYVRGLKDGHAPNEVIYEYGLVEKEKETSRREAFLKIVQEKPEPDEVKKLLKKPENAFMILNTQKLMDYCKMMYEPKPLAWRLKVLYICGPSGTGKSYLANNIMRRFDKYCSVTFSYSGQIVNMCDRAQCILFDDWNPNSPNVSKQTFYRMLDPYGMMVDVKMSSAIYEPRCVIITRIQRPDQLTEFGWSQSDIFQLHRRITAVVVANNAAGQHTYWNQTDGVNFDEDGFYHSCIEDLTNDN